LLLTKSTLFAYTTLFRSGKSFNASQKEKKNRTDYAMAKLGVDPSSRTLYTSPRVSTPSDVAYEPFSWFIRAGINSTNYLIDGEGSGLDNRTGFFADLGYEVRGKTFGFAFSLMYSGEGGMDAGVSYLTLNAIPKIYIARVIFL